MRLPLRKNPWSKETLWVWQALEAAYPASFARAGEAINRRILLKVADPATTLSLYFGQPAVAIEITNAARLELARTSPMMLELAEYQGIIRRLLRANEFYKNAHLPQIEVARYDSPEWTYEMIFKALLDFNIHSRMIKPPKQGHPLDHYSDLYGSSVKRRLLDLLPAGADWKSEHLGIGLETLQQRLAEALEGGLTLHSAGTTASKVTGIPKLRKRRPP